MRITCGVPCHVAFVVAYGDDDSRFSWLACARLISASRACGGLSNQHPRELRRRAYIDVGCEIPVRQNLLKPRLRRRVELPGICHDGVERCYQIGIEEPFGSRSFEMCRPVGPGVVIRRIGSASWRSGRSAQQIEAATCQSSLRVLCVTEREPFVRALCRVHYEVRERFVHHGEETVVFRGCCWRSRKCQPRIGSDDRRQTTQHPSSVFDGAFRQLGRDDA